MQFPTPRSFYYRQLTVFIEDVLPKSFLFDDDLVYRIPACIPTWAMLPLSTDWTNTGPGPRIRNPYGIVVSVRRSEHTRLEEKLFGGSLTVAQNVSDFLESIFSLAKQCITILQFRTSLCVVGRQTVALFHYLDVLEILLHELQ